MYHLVLRIVVNPAAPPGTERDAALTEQARRSATLRIGLLESGYDLVASLPVDVFLLAQRAGLAGLNEKARPAFARLALPDTMTHPETGATHSGVSNLGGGRNLSSNLLNALLFQRLR